MEKQCEHKIDCLIYRINENEWKKAILDNDLIILELNSSMPVDHVNAFIDAVEANL